MARNRSPTTTDPPNLVQDKRFIAVNANYRLGLLGYYNAANGEMQNAGLLDARFAISWVKQHIAEFGGDGNKITISGQSGGAGIIMVSSISTKIAPDPRDLGDGG